MFIFGTLGDCRDHRNVLELTGLTNIEEKVSYAQQFMERTKIMQEVVRLDLLCCV